MESNSQLVEIGDIIQFGKYNWRVLDIQDDKALILTDEIIDKRKYNKEQNVTWEKCDLRRYLNGEFFQTFTEEEQKNIVKTQIINNDNIWYESKGGENTIDKIFLLSLEEIDKYFGYNGYYLNKRRMSYDDKKILIDIANGHCFANIYEIKYGVIDNKYLFWWLRSPGIDNKNAACVIGDGNIVNVLGRSVNLNDGSVRPALWLNLQTVTLKEIIKKPVSQSVKKKEIIQFGNYNWRVLEKQDDKMLILSEDIIGDHNFHDDFKNVTWETCDLRKYLNNEFLQKFSEEEQSRIVETQITNNDNLWYKTKGGNDTLDKIFLLSLEEVDKYFGNSGDYTNKRRKNNKEYLSNVYNNERIAKFNNEEYVWWLRSPGFMGNSASYVEDNGAVCVVGIWFIFGGIRPAMWVRV